MNFRLKTHADILVIPLFFAQMIGTFWFVFVLLGIESLFKFKLKNFIENKFFFLCMGIFIILKLFQGINFQTLIFFKTFFGIFFFIFYFRYFNFLSIDKILISLMSITLIGHFLIKASSYLSEFDKPFWRMAYPRPTGFAQNTTIATGILIIFLISCWNKLPKNWRKLLILDVIFCGSGLGYVGLIYLFFIKNWNRIKHDKKKLLVLSIIILLFYFGIYGFMGTNLYTGNFLYKISPYYIWALMKLKLDMLIQLKSFSSIVDMLIGIPWNGKHFNGGDFGWLQIIWMTGICGVLLNIIFLKNFVREKFVLFFLLTSIFHYNLIWWPAGQIFLGYIIGKQLRVNSSEENNVLNFDKF